MNPIKHQFKAVIIIGKKGKPILCKDGYSYFKKRDVIKTNEIYWLCSSNTKCFASVSTLQGTSVITRIGVPHIHPPMNNYHF